jgi:hypothetical protein
MITEKYIIYDQSGYPWVEVPGTIRPSSALFQVSGKNHLGSPKYIGYQWTITQGMFNIIEQQEIWSWFAVPGNNQSNFAVQGGLIDFDTAGDWNIMLKMFLGDEPYDPNALEVDGYSGLLCTVSSMPFGGTLVQVAVIEKDTGYGTEAPGEWPFNHTGYMRIVARNEMDTPQAMGIGWTIKYPGGEVAQTYSLAPNDWPTIPSGQMIQVTGYDIDFNISGIWLINVDVLMNVALPELVDRYTGTLVEVSDGGGNGGNGGGGGSSSLIIPAAILGVGIVGVAAITKPKRKEP